MAKVAGAKTKPALDAERVRFTVGDARVSGILHRPRGARSCCVLAHGAGAGMEHPFLTAIAAGLGERGIASFRYQFPYMERGSGRPDSPKIAEAAVRAAVVEAGRLVGKLPLLAGGKSYGGRMTSQAEASEHLPGVVGLAFLGFPLHAPGKPSDERAAHLLSVNIPMLFLQGTRDDFASMDLLKPLCKRIGKKATLRLFEEADHSFHVPARTGKKDSDVRAELLDAFAEWAETLAG